MKRTLEIFLLMLCCAAVSALAAKPPAYLLECAVYRIAASVSGDTSLTEDVRPPGSSEPATAVRGRLSLFTLADLRIGATRFRLDEKGATWDGRATPPDRDEVILLTHPRVATREGIPAVIEIGGEESIQFMNRRQDGLFELKTTTVKTGISTRFTPKNAGSNLVRLDPFAIEIQSVSGRKRVNDVQLDIGEPELRKDAESMTLALNLEHFYGILLRSEREGMLLIILRVRLAEGLPSQP